MIPRPKSIFTLGEEEEGGDGKEEESMTVAIVNYREVVVKSTKGSPAPDLVGLRILIQCSGKVSNVVVKSTVVRSSSRPVVSRARRSPAVSLPESSSFLKACFLCKKELNPQKDVYMYRGDQGFCSVECRCRQMVLDERREFEASAGARQQRLASAHPGRVRSGHHGRVRESDRRRRILVSA